MKNLSVGSLFTRLLIFAAVFMSLSAGSAKVGVDSFEIYLNNKLLLQQSLGKPLNLIDLPITEANAGYNLVIRYSQCNAPDKIGRGRSITVKDAQGKMVKEWKFKDAAGSNTSMVIPVKELLDVRKKLSGTVEIYYAAEGLPKGQKLATLQAGKKNNT